MNFLFAEGASDFLVDSAGRHLGRPFCSSGGHRSVETETQNEDELLDYALSHCR